MKYIDCEKYAQEILDEVKAIPNKGKLVIITVGDDPASQVYVRGKIKDCEYCEIPVEHVKIADTADSHTKLINTICRKNNDMEVAGIILQLPLPESLKRHESYYCDLIAPIKDVDGLNPNSRYQPCTPKGIMHILKKELGRDELSELTALIIGRSNLVGKPLAKMLTDADCTVTLAHSKTHPLNLREYMKTADIVVSAVGQAKEFNLADCWMADVVVDVGINRDNQGKLCGDFTGFRKFGGCGTKVTPVPKGVGLMTRAMLMQNVAEASAMFER